MKVNSICILGGGTAGWMTAASLVKNFPEKTITLVESEEVPRIGVGESTLQKIRYWLDDLGIKDSDFMKHCDATYKQSIKFVNFNDNLGDWHYPFTSNELPPGTKYDIADWFIHAGLNPETPAGDFARWITPNYKCLEENRIPTHDMPGFKFHYQTAFHFDALKFSHWLRDEYCVPRGLQHKRATVVDVEYNDDGGIKCLVDDEGKTFEADLFVDCTGFRSFLLQDKLGTPFDSMGDVLINNKAWHTTVPYKDKKKELNVYTTCTAMSAGWIWNIPLTHRAGTGYVFCDKFISEEDALEEFQEHLGHPEGAEYRLINFKTGITQKVWNKNVVGIGLSSGFIEPLESNGVAFSHDFAMILCDVLSRRDKVNAIDRNTFNVRCRNAWFDFAWFVAFHFGLQTRDDTPYWRHVTDNIDWCGGFASHNPEIVERFIVVKKMMTSYDLTQWTHDNMTGLSYIAAANKFNPFTQWTLRDKIRNGELDPDLFQELPNWDNDKYQESFPFAHEYYES